MTFDRLIKVALMAGHAVRMGLLVGIVALGSVALWMFGNRPDPGWAEAFRADLEAGPVPAAEIAPRGWQRLCRVPNGLAPGAALAGEGAAPLTGCEPWKPWYRYYPEVEALAFAAEGSCRAYPVPRGVLRLTEGDAPICHARRGFTQFALGPDGAFRVEHR